MVHREQVHAPAQINSGAKEAGGRADCAAEEIGCLEDAAHSLSASGVQKVIWMLTGCSMSLFFSASVSARWHTAS